MTITSRGRKFTYKYNIINTQLRERESARALQTIRTVEFLQKLSTITDVTMTRNTTVYRYHGIFEMVYNRWEIYNIAHL